MKRRDILKGIGAIVGVGVVGKVAATQAAPVEVLPVVQAPQVPSWIGKGSITVTGSARGFTLMGTGSYEFEREYALRHPLPRRLAEGTAAYWTADDWNEYRHQMQTKLSGFDDDGGAV